MIRSLIKRAALVAAAVFLWASPVHADSEAGNTPVTVTGPYGHCVATSVPKHDYDQPGEPRQQGRTEIRRVDGGEGTLLQSYDWYSSSLFVICPPDGKDLVVRLGPWPRGHNPREDHLALAFYSDGKLLKRYSTLDIAGGEKSEPGAISDYKNITPTVSHYFVFSRQPTLTKIADTDDWVIEATTVDGRELVFDVETGAPR